MGAEDQQQSHRAAAASDQPTTGSDLAAHQLQEETRTAQAIYGVIVGTAVMAAAHGEAVGQLAVAVLVTLLIYWAAERYAVVMARRIVLGRGLTRAEMGRALSEGWPLVTASFAPLLVLLGASVLGADLAGSVFSALVCSTGLLSYTGWRVGHEAHLDLLQRLGSATIAGAFGVVMIVLHALLH